MLDGGEADDKIIAILKGDGVYEDWEDITDCPPTLVRRLEHYFLTYKQIPGEEENKCEIVHTYGREEAQEVITRSMKDYKVKFGNLEHKLSMKLIEAISYGQSWQAAMAVGQEEF